MGWLLVPAVAGAATWTVDPSGAGDYTTISAAVAAAGFGDRIEVLGGTYAESIDLGTRSLTIVGLDGPDATVVDAAGRAFGVRIRDTVGAAVSVSGLTVRGAPVVVDGASPLLEDMILREAGDGTGQGGLLQVDGGTPLVSATTFDRGSAEYGGLIAVHSGALTLTDCVLSYGEASVGGALHVGEGAAATLERSSILHNDALAGGGAVRVEGGGILVVVDSSFEDNHTAEGHGGAVSVGPWATATVTGGTFVSNHADDPTLWGYGGAIFASDAVLTVSGTVFDENTAGLGGALGLVGTEATLDAVTGEANVASTYGGAVAAEGATVLTETGSTWTANGSYYHGGTLWLAYGASATIHGTVYDESLVYYGSGGSVSAYDAGALELDGVVSTGSYAYNGGTLYVYAVEAPIVVRNSSFTNSYAQYGYGGAIYGYYYVSLTLEDSVFDGCTADYDGGGVYWHYGRTLDVVRTTFTDNRAGRAGGGLYAYSVRWPTELRVNLTDSVFENNTAGVAGGGWYGYGPYNASVRGVSFVNNEAEGDGYGGGAAVTAAVTLEVSDSRFADNFAEYGGAFYLEEMTDPAASARFDHVVFQENRAAWCGALCVSRLTAPATATLEHSVLIGNAATEDAAAVGVVEAGVALRHTGITHHAEGVAVVVWDEASTARSSTRWGGWFNNAEGDATNLDLDPDDVRADPRYATVTLDGNPDDDSFVLTDGSLWIDAGSPKETDPDGTRADIGLWGGDFTLADADGDGFTNQVDCDDANRTVHPGAGDTPYDGVNQDCAPGSDFDADGDGADVDWAGGADCDDTDPAVIEGCEEPVQETGDTGPATEETETEQTESEDTDDGEPTEPPGPGETGGSVKACGCTSGPGATAPMWIGAAALAFRRWGRR